jgi:hypothetical protein
MVADLLVKGRPEIRHGPALACPSTPPTPHVVVSSQWIQSTVQLSLTHPLQQGRPNQIGTVTRLRNRETLNLECCTFFLQSGRIWPHQYGRSSSRREWGAGGVLGACWRGCFGWGLAANPAGRHGESERASRCHAVGEFQWIRFSSSSYVSFASECLPLSSLPLSWSPSFASALPCLVCVCVCVCVCVRACGHRSGPRVCCRLAR